VSSKAIDEDIQEAIRLHEAGDLEQSTKLFGRLADPEGANNPLSQVLYGLALRYVDEIFYIILSGIYTDPSRKNPTCRMPLEIIAITNKDHIGLY
jgi:hypothetical protein